jgi:hypothetical protein
LDPRNCIFATEMPSHIQGPQPQKPRQPVTSGRSFRSTSKMSELPVISRVG